MFPPAPAPTTAGTWARRNPLKAWGSLSCGQGARTHAAPQASGNSCATFTSAYAAACTKSHGLPAVRIYLARPGVALYYGFLAGNTNLPSECSLWRPERKQSVLPTLEEVATFSLIKGDEPE